MVSKSTLAALVISASVSSFAQQSTASDSRKTGAEAKYTSSNELKIVEYQTDQGNVKVILPSDLIAGATISGTVIVEPKGRTTGEGVLTGMVIDIAGTKVSADKSRFKLQLPVAVGITGAMIILMSNSGQTVCSESVPVLQNSPVIETPSGSKFGIPNIAQVGHPISIKGIFDADSENTIVKIGGLSATVLAESDNQTVVSNPVLTAGPQEVDVSEGVKQGTGKLNILKISLSVPRSNLLKGERETLNVRVSGLKELPQNSEPVWIQLVNQSPGTISLGSRQTITHQIKPDQVAADGTASYGTLITATQAGGFSVSGTVMTPLIARGAIFSNLSFWEKAARWVSDRKWSVGPSLEDLVAKLAELRTNKRNDWDHDKKYQAAMAAEIEKIKHAMRSHHGPGGEKAALNDPGDYDPPKYK